MTGGIDRAQAEDFLYREAALLDGGEWDAWLQLYTEDAVFWMPAWRDEQQPTADPDRELSLIYYEGRAGLADRVFRARSGQSLASSPLPRCVHAINNVVLEAGDGAPSIASNFAVHLYDVRADRTHIFFGRYRHRLRFVDGQWRIAAKTIWLLNDSVPTVIDFYSV